LIIRPGESQGTILYIVGKTVIVVSAESFLAAETIEELKALGAEAIVIIEQGKADLTKLQGEYDANLKALTDLKILFDQEVQAHGQTKELSAGLITDLKEQLAVANANIGSDSPIISYKSKKMIVGSTRFHLPKDTKEYTLEDLKKGKESNTLIERILAIKGQGILSEATA
jgi:hypothetical protein